jgi:hypothetical protein
MMAIGFNLASVHEIQQDDEERAIFFQLKNVRYKIIFDDDMKAEEVIKIIRSFMANRKQSQESKRQLPEFYKG